MPHKKRRVLQARAFTEGPPSPYDETHDEETRPFEGARSCQCRFVIIENWRFSVKTVTAKTQLFIGAQCAHYNLLFKLCHKMPF